MYQMRPYSPSVGRWVSRDPAPLQGPYLDYAFLANDPPTAVDAFGLREYRLPKCTVQIIIADSSEISGYSITSLDTCSAASAISCGNYGEKITPPSIQRPLPWWAPGRKPAPTDRAPRVTDDITGTDPGLKLPDAVRLARSDFFTAVRETGRGSFFGGPCCCKMVTVEVLCSSRFLTAHHYLALTAPGLALPEYRETCHLKVFVFPASSR